MLEMEIALIASIDFWSCYNMLLVHYLHFKQRRQSCTTRNCPNHFQSPQCSCTKQARKAQKEDRARESEIARIGYQRQIVLDSVSVT